MAKEQGPKLTLGEPPGKLKSRGQGNSSLLGISLQIAILAAVIILLFRERGSPLAGEGAKPSASDLEAIALTLEDKGVDGPAAEAWERYLLADPTTSRRPQILYRIGKHQMQAGAFDKAVAAFVRAEQCTGADAELKQKIGPKMVLCLSKLGLYGEVSRELSRRVQVGASDSTGARPLATFAGEAITEADLDRMIERRVDEMLALQGVDPGAKEREALLKRLRSPSMRQQLFSEVLQTELFSRRARELKLDREEGFLTAMQLLQRQQLASRFLQSSLEKIQPTSVDISSYYQAHPEQYREPEKAQVVLISVNTEAEADSLLASIGSSQDFLRVAAERSHEAKGGEPGMTEVVRGRPDPRLGSDLEPIFSLAEGGWTTSPIKGKGERHLALVKKKTASRLPDLSEVRDRVERDYTSLKRQELVEKIFRDLQERYDVKILAQPGGAPVSEEKKEDER